MYVMTWLPCSNFKHFPAGWHPYYKSREDTHEMLRNMDVVMTKEENCCAINGIENGNIVFTCLINLQCLCDVEEVFMDGTFKCCLKYFSQLYTIHGYKNGNYVPLVFTLLNGKSECLFKMLL